MQPYYKEKTKEYFKKVGGHWVKDKNKR
jgi:hypothetical protein